MRSMGSCASSSRTPIKNSAGKSRGAVASANCRSAPCAVTVSLSSSSSMNASPLCSVSSLHAAHFMLAGPSILGVNVSNVSMPWAPSSTLHGTPALGN